MKPSEQGSIFWAGRNESKQWYAMIKTYKNINISAQYQYFCMKPSEQGLFFWAGQNEFKQWYAMIKTYKNINISARYQYFCMKPSEQAQFSESIEMSPKSGMLWSKLTKHKYLSMIFPSQSKWVQRVVCYDQNLQKHNISARYQYFCTKPSEQGSFFRAGQNESKQWYAMIKT